MNENVIDMVKILEKNAAEVIMVTLIIIISIIAQ